MATTYTSPMGLTPQGQGVDSLTSSIQNITGGFPLAASIQAGQQASQMQANEPTFKANEMVGLSNKYQIPQSTDYYSKIVDLYMHDKNLNQQFQGNMGNTPITTMPGTDVVSAVPRLTPENLNQPFSGFTDPVQAANASEAQSRGVMNTLANLGKLIDANYKTLGKQFDVDTSAYESMVKAKQDEAQGYLDVYKELAKQGLTKKEILDLGLQGAAVGKKLDLTDPNNPQWVDAGTNTPDDYADQFMGGELKWADIPDAMKNSVTKVVKNRGSTVDKVNQSYQAIDNSIADLDKAFGLWESMSEAEKRLPTWVIEKIPGASPKRAEITSLFYTTLEPEIRKSAVGGRITQQEIGWIRGAIMPTPTDTLESARAKIEAIKYGLQQKLKNKSYTIGDNTLQEYNLQSGMQSAMGQTGTQTGGSVRLKSPDGKTYEYDGTSDPDYVSDLKSGFKPI